MDERILVLGGTGAMGMPLVKRLNAKGYSIDVTSRSPHDPYGNVTYIQGNARDRKFILSLLEKHHYSAIVDFMVYNTEEFKNIVDIFLTNTMQYVFLSSARVYAPSAELISENSPRLLDVCQDQEYLQTEEYALCKARQEDILRFSGNNWTIIRPSLTYNTERLQLPLDEKEAWLGRVLCGNSIVFPTDMGEIYQTMSYGDDVSKAIAALVNNRKAFGEIVHIAGARPIQWKKVLEIYINTLKQHGISSSVYYVDNSQEISKKLGCQYQYRYARATSRRFDNSKLLSITGEIEFKNPEVGLSMCLSEFLRKGNKIKMMPVRSTAYYDKLTGEHTSLKKIKGIKRKIYYIMTRCFY